jgi:N-terminal TM domain of oligopeptide transport permease C
MTDIAIARRESGFAAFVHQARYVISENPVTGFAFALFLLIVLAAVFGPHIVPYDPLASNTAEALKAPTNTAATCSAGSSSPPGSISSSPWPRSFWCF